MTIRFHILEASGALTGVIQDRVRAALEQGQARAELLLELSQNIDVIVMNAPYAVIPSLGINGFSYDAHHIQIQLDVAHPQLTVNFDHAVSSILAHELHHSARSRALGHSHGKTYGNMLVAEGLACCFEEETGHLTPFYANQCSGKQLFRFAKRAKTQIASPRDDLPGGWQGWMFGSREEPEVYPYQCGYSLGYTVVRHWLDRTGTTAALAYAASAEEVLEDWISDALDPLR